MKKLLMKINVMGTEYKVFTATSEDFDRLKVADGYILPEPKEIYIDKNNSKVHQRHVLLHELTHAFLFESGLSVETWANNEEIVDWIAIQLEKMYSTGKKSIKEMEEKLYPRKKREKKNTTKK